MKKRTLEKLSMLLFTLALCSCSSGSNYSGFLDSQTSQVRSYQFGPQTTTLSGPSNRTLAAAEYRSDIQADTVENYARAQHAELGVVDHKLDTARKAQYYDHQAHMDTNLEHRDDFSTVQSITGSVSSSAFNVHSAIHNIGSIFK